MAKTSENSAVNPLSLPTTIIQCTPVDMPIPNSSGAPKFSGHYTKVETFLAHCERLFKYYNVKTNEEKICHMVSYCTCPVKEIIEGLPHYYDANWTLLHGEMLKVFNSECNHQKFTVSTLCNYTYQQQGKHITSLDAFHEYE